MESFFSSIVVTASQARLSARSTCRLSPPVLTGLSSIRKTRVPPGKGDRSPITIANAADLRLTLRHTRSWTINGTNWWMRRCRAQCWSRCTPRLLNDSPTSQWTLLQLSCTVAWPSFMSPRRPGWLRRFRFCLERKRPASSKFGDPCPHRRWRCSFSRTRRVSMSAWRLASYGETTTSILTKFSQSCERHYIVRNKSQLTILSNYKLSQIKISQQYHLTIKCRRKYHGDVAHKLRIIVCSKYCLC